MSAHQPYPPAAPGLQGPPLGAMPAQAAAEGQLDDGEVPGAARNLAIAAFATFALAWAAQVVFAIVVLGSGLEEFRESGSSEAFIDPSLTIVSGLIRVAGALVPAVLGYLAFRAAGGRGILPRVALGFGAVVLAAAVLSLVLNLPSMFL